MSFASMLGGLTKIKIRFVVIGGVAAAIHGSSRVTNDLDICYDAGDRANVAALARLLAGWKAYPRGVEQDLPFIMDDRTMRGAPIMTLATTEGDLDIMDRVAGVGDYAIVRKHSQEITALGLSFQVIDLAWLIKAKRAAGRPRDFDHLPELEALLELRKKP
ncbi:MAG: hypothetical protein ACJ8AK_16150 [Gemmatimonadaceae bacterium]